MPANNSNLGGLAFGAGHAFTGNNAFAFGASQAFAFGGGADGGIDQYGFAGFPGNPMLAAGLISARAAVLPELQPASSTDYGDPAGDRGGPVTLQTFHRATAVRDWGSAPSSALALIELMKSIDFEELGPQGLRLQARDDKGALRPLLTMQCPDLDFFRGQLWMVDRDAVLRDTRVAEVLTQVTTPLSYFATVVNLQAGRHPHTLALVDVALKFAYAVGMRFKHAFAVPRPSDLSALMQPMIEVPQHASYPMGHAIEAHLIAGLLSRLVPGLGTGSAARRALRRNAYRIAYNRVIAGLHYPIDAIPGRLLGDALAVYVSALGKDAAWKSAQFDVANLPADATMGETDDEFVGLNCTQPSGDMPKASPIFQELWKQASEEWA
jgi:membrane-associated phospholipid phosphatase